jgi:hypothetical protein
MRGRILLICGTLLVTASYALAKRLPPAMVEPVVADGVKYLAPQVTPGYIEAYGVPACPSGCVEAREEKTGKLLWRVQVYEVQYDNHLERDVQDVFVRSLKIEDGSLLVENESDARFTVDLKSHTVKRREQPWK